MASVYSHLGGVEFLHLRRPGTYSEILSIVNTLNVRYNSLGQIDSLKLQSEVSNKLSESGWRKSRLYSYTTQDNWINLRLSSLNLARQKTFLNEVEQPNELVFKVMDFVKNKIAVEVQLGKYFAVTYDRFVKHLSFYTGQIIDVGIEIVPMKAMQQQMSSGPPWFEKEVHNVLRHGRTNPPVPLLIIGIEP